MRVPGTVTRWGRTRVWMPCEGVSAGWSGAVGAEPLPAPSIFTSKLAGPLRVQPATVCWVRVNRRYVWRWEEWSEGSFSTRELQASSSKTGKTTSTLETSRRSNLGLVGVALTVALLFIHVKSQHHCGVGIKGVQRTAALEELQSRELCCRSWPAQTASAHQTLFCAPGCSVLSDAPKAVTSECTQCLPSFLLCLSVSS